MKKSRNPKASRAPLTRRSLARLLRKVRGTFLGALPGFRRSRAANDPNA